MKKLIFISLFTFIVLIGTAQNSFACSCAISDKPLKTQVKDAYANSTAIFSGEVTDITAKDEWTVIVKIKVAKSWKGKVAKNITISTSKESSLCGYSFEVGKKYLVYANGTNQALSTTNCSRTTEASNKTDIKYLDNLKAAKTKKGNK